MPHTLIIIPRLLTLSANQRMISAEECQKANVKGEKRRLKQETRRSGIIGMAGKTMDEEMGDSEMRQTPPQESGGRSTLSYESAANASRPSGKAFALALIFGAFCFAATMSVPYLHYHSGVMAAAVILAILATSCAFVARSDSPAGSRQRRWENGLLWVVMGAIWLSLAVMFLSYYRELSEYGSMKCPRNLRQIGQAILLYAMDNKGVSPPTLDVLIAADGMSPEVFVCPSSNNVKASGATTQQVIQNFRANPKQCSYIYVGAGLTQKTATAEHLMVYEPLANHGTGIDILYGDGHTDWLDKREAQYVISELQSGHNPPRPQPDKAGKP